MKKLGKVLLSLLLAVVLLSGTMTVKAMSEKDLLSKIKASYTVNGKEIKLDSSYVNSAKRYLDEFEVSAADCDYIAARIDKAIEVYKNAGVTEFSALSAADKNKLKAIVEEVSANTSVKATLTKDGLVVYNPNTNAEFAVVGKDVIAYTGANNILIIMAALVSVAGLSAFVLKAKKNNA